MNKAHDVQILWLAAQNSSKPLFLSLLEKAIGIGSTLLLLPDPELDFQERSKVANLLIYAEHPEDAIKIAKLRPTTEALTILLCKISPTLDQLVHYASAVPNGIFYRKPHADIRMRPLLLALTQGSLPEKSFWGTPGRVIKSNASDSTLEQRYALDDLIPIRCLNRLPDAIRPKLSELANLAAIDTTTLNGQTFSIEEWKATLSKLSPKLADEVGLLSEFYRDFKGANTNSSLPLRSDNELVDFIKKDLPSDFSLTRLSWSYYAPLWQYGPVLRWYEIDRERQLATDTVDFLFKTSQLATDQRKPNEINEIDVWTNKRFLLAIQASRQGGKFENSLRLAKLANELNPNEVELKRELAICHAILDNFDQAIAASKPEFTTGGTLLHQRYLWHINYPDKLGKPTEESASAFMPSESERWENIFDPAATLTHQLFQQSPEQALSTLEKSIAQFPEQRNILFNFATFRALASGNFEFITRIQVDSKSFTNNHVPLGQLISATIIASARQQRDEIKMLWQELSKRASKLLAVHSADNYNLIYYISIVLKLSGYPERSKVLEKLSSSHAPQYRISQHHAKSIPIPNNPIPDLSPLHIEG